MANITMVIPEDLNKIMKRHRDVKWSEIARTALWEYGKKLEMVNSIAGKSKLTKKDIEEIDRLVKEGVAKKHGIRK